VDRFVEKVCPEPGGCWIWIGSTNSKGYGRFRVGRKIVKAHRWAFEQHHGRPPDGMVLHTCDRPACVRPSHLKEGIHAENMADMRARGRSSRGRRNGRAKLDDDTVRTLRAMVKTGKPKDQVAAHFGISRNHVDKIVRGDQWSHV